MRKKYHIRTNWKSTCERGA